MVLYLYMFCVCVFILFVNVVSSFVCLNVISSLMYYFVLCLRISFCLGLLDNIIVSATRSPLSPIGSSEAGWVGGSMSLAGWEGLKI